MTFAWPVPVGGGGHPIWMTLPCNDLAHRTGLPIAVISMQCCSSRAHCRPDAIHSGNACVGFEQDDHPRQWRERARLRQIFGDGPTKFTGILAWRRRYDRLYQYDAPTVAV